MRGASSTAESLHVNSAEVGRIPAVQLTVVDEARLGEAASSCASNHAHAVRYCGVFVHDEDHGVPARNPPHDSTRMRVPIRLNMDHLVQVLLSKSQFQAWPAHGLEADGRSIASPCLQCE